MQGRIEGLKQGLKYAFTVAALFEGLEMLYAGSYHLQPFHEWETGLVAGVAIGIAAYVSDNHGTVTYPAYTEADGDAWKRTVAESAGKIVELPLEYGPRP